MYFVIFVVCEVRKWKWITNWNESKVIIGKIEPPVQGALEQGYLRKLMAACTIKKLKERKRERGQKLALQTKICKTKFFFNQYWWRDVMRLRPFPTKQQSSEVPFWFHSKIKKKWIEGFLASKVTQCWIHGRTFDNLFI